MCTTASISYSCLNLVRSVAEVLLLPLSPASVLCFCLNLLLLQVPELLDTEPGMVTVADLVEKEVKALSA